MALIRARIKITKKDNGKTAVTVFMGQKATLRYNQMVEQGSTKKRAVASAFVASLSSTPLGEVSAAVKNYTKYSDLSEKDTKRAVSRVITEQSRRK